MRNTIMLTIAAAMLLVGCSKDSGSPGGSTASSGSGKNSPATTQSATTTQKETTMSAAPAAANPVVVIETSLGTITAELWADKAPITVKNFATYADEHFFDGTIFHRVIPDFMIQGGGFDPKMQQKTTHGPIKNEARSDVQNKRGTLAMARTSEVDSATAQFFINLKDNDFLDHTSNTPRGFGYCVFGKVTGGMDVVDKIAKVQTRTVGPHENVPAEPVKIISIRQK